MGQLMQATSRMPPTETVVGEPLTYRQRGVFITLLMLGVLQFVWSYLYRIPSEIHLLAYEQGLERMPFQSRLLMAAPLRWAHGSVVLQVWAAHLSTLPAWFPRVVGPEGLLQASVDCVAVGVACLAAMALYKRCSRRLLLPWLVAPLLLVLCFSTYIGLAHHSIRFIYDLPAMAFFSAGLWLIHRDRWGPWSVATFMAVFVVGTLNRETTLMLLVFGYLAERRRGRLRKWIAALGFVLLLFWLIFHSWAATRFQGNPHANSHLIFVNLGSLLVPLCWPQLAGVLGYLWFPLLVFRHHIPDGVLRSWLLGLGVWLGVMTIFGLLVETRLWGELLPYAACTVTLIAEEMLAKRFGLPATEFQLHKQAIPLEGMHFVGELQPIAGGENRAALNVLADRLNAP